MWTLALIAGVASNGVIGRDGRLPWSCPEDLRWFKHKTLGKPVIMGRKTFESLPNGALPERTNIVVTRNKDYVAEGATVVHDIHEAVREAIKDPSDEIVVMGGGELYTSYLPLADVLYLTEFQHSFEGDAHFPKIDPDIWIEWRRKLGELATAELPYYFVEYRRRDEVFFDKLI